jgi:hypothetical protein
MPTLLSSMFAFRRAEGSKRVTRSDAPRETFEAKPFIPAAPHVSHTIRDTLAYMNLVRDRSSASVLADYALRFVASSAEMHRLDEAIPSIMMAPNKPQTFPNVVVELARLIPADADGTLNSRREFLAGGLSRSLTLRASLAAYDAEEGIDPMGLKPSAAWALRRAFRSFGDDMESVGRLANALSEAIPQHKWEIAHIHRDYLLNPKLRKFDAGFVTPHL